MCLYFVCDDETGILQLCKADSCFDCSVQCLHLSKILHVLVLIYVMLWYDDSIMPTQNIVTMTLAGHYTWVFFKTDSLIICQKQAGSLRIEGSRLDLIKHIFILSDTCQKSQQFFVIGPRPDFQLAYFVLEPLPKFLTISDPVPISNWLILSSNP